MCGESRGSSRPNAVTMLPLLQLAMAWSFATVTSAASGRACTVHMPRIGQPAVASLAPMSRRAVLTSAAALPLFAAAPLLAATVCSCPNGPDSCVCVEKELAKDKKRADAAGRDAAQSKLEVAQLRKELEDMENGPKSGKGREDTRNVLAEKQRRASGIKSRQDDEPPVTSAPTDPGFLGLTGGSSQNYGEVDKNDAELRFQAIVAETAKKREADFGFELDDDDIRQIEAVLRPKYCGPQGLIGPCLTASPADKKKKKK